MSVKDLSNYKVLSQKQRVANKYLKDAYDRLGENRYYNNAINRVNKFQKDHRQKVSTKLTLRGLTDKDTEKYENILDSIIESTYINPTKYSQHRERQIAFAISEGWAKNEAQAEKVYNFANSDLIDKLKDIGLRDIPSKIVEKYGKYVQGKMSETEFESMSELFLSLYQEGIVDYDDFFQFADDYKDYSVINERQRVYGIMESNSDFFGSLIRSDVMASPDLQKAMYEYREEPQFDEYGNILSFLDYFNLFYS